MPIKPKKSGKIASGSGRAASVKVKPEAPDSPEAASAPLGDQAYMRLRLQILTLELQPGEKVSEGTLAKRYRIGRTPIRAALQRLVQDELVVNLGRRGTFIAALTLQDVADIFAIRRLLAPEVVRLAAGRINPKQLRQLQAMRESMTYDRSDHASVVKFLLQNRSCNMAIIAGCDNRRLVNTMAELEDLMLRGLYLAFKGSDLSDPYHEVTAELCDALANGDGMRARELALKEVDWAERMVLEAIMRLPGMRSTNIYDR